MHVDARNQTWSLCKSRKCSVVLSHLPSFYLFVYLFSLCVCIHVSPHIHMPQYTCESQRTTCEAPHSYIWVSDTKLSSWSLSKHSEHAFACRAAVEIAFTLLFKLCMFVFSASLGRGKSWRRLLSPHIPPHPLSCEAAVVSVYWAGDFLHTCDDPGCLFLFARRHATAPWGTVTWKGSQVGRSCFLGRSLVTVYGDFHQARWSLYSESPVSHLGV